MITTAVLIVCGILVTAGALWRYLRARRRLERALLYGPYREGPVSTEDLESWRASWRAMGHLNRRR